MTARVLIVDHAHSVVCGIHDLGERIAACLRHSTELEVNRLDIANADDWRNALNVVEPDMVIVNYRPDLMPWAPAALLNWPRPPAFAVLHQYEEATAYRRAATIRSDGFDGVLALDPLLDTSQMSGFHAVGRPIPETVEHTNEVTRSDTRIGSFGFAFPHKQFHHVAAEVASLGWPATYNLHMPEAYFNGAQGGPLFTWGIVEAIGEQMTNPDVTLTLTQDHLAERELVHRLSLNDVNCLLYAPGQPDAGLSSALDYLIAARRPMLLSGADMFRHAWMEPNDRHRANATPGATVLGTFGAAPWPNVRLGDVLANYPEWQLLADELYAWHHGRLVADIEALAGTL